MKREALFEIGEFVQNKSGFPDMGIHVFEVIDRIFNDNYWLYVLKHEDGSDNYFIKEDEIEKYGTTRKSLFQMETLDKIKEESKLIINQINPIIDQLVLLSRRKSDLIYSDISINERKIRLEEIKKMREFYFDMAEQTLKKLVEKLF